MVKLTWRSQRAVSGGRGSSQPIARADIFYCRLLPSFGRRMYCPSSEAFLVACVHEAFLALEPFDLDKALLVEGVFA
jgi:hypothetical protein